MQTKTGRVLRAFYYQRTLLKVGETVTLPSLFAREVAAANKLELLDASPGTTPAEAAQIDKKSQAEPAIAEEAVEKPKSKGGKAHAG